MIITLTLSLFLLSVSSSSIPSSTLSSTSLSSSHHIHIIIIYITIIIIIIIITTGHYSKVSSVAVLGGESYTVQKKSVCTQVIFTDEYDDDGENDDD